MVVCEHVYVVLVSFPGTRANMVWLMNTKVASQASLVLVMMCLLLCTAATVYGICHVVDPTLPHLCGVEITCRIGLI
jgi:hypothetical protein